MGKGQNIWSVKDSHLLLLKTTCTGVKIAQQLNTFKKIINFLKKRLKTVGRILRPLCPKPLKKLSLKMSQNYFGIKKHKAVAFTALKKKKVPLSHPCGDR